MSVSVGKVQTSHGVMAYSETTGSGLPVVLLHGNSADRRAFDRQMSSDLGATHRLIAFDLPGHGESDDAIDPERTYTQRGYADAVIEALANMRIERVVVFGWSLGGHIGLEMVPHCRGLVALMISGAPPIRSEFAEAQAGFQPLPNVEIIGKPVLSDEEVAMLAYVTYGDLADEAAVAAIRRTDGQARAIQFANLVSGGISDQRRIAETMSAPLAIVNGEADPLVNLDYVSGLQCPSLWEDHHFILRGAAHAPFLQVPEVFNPILARFAADAAQRTGTSGNTREDAVSAA